MNSQKNFKYNKRFWKNKKILITGATGFVGQNLLNHLNFIKKNINFTIFKPSSHQLDLTNPLKVNSYFKKKRPDIVIHLAGKVGGIGINRLKQADFFYQNLLMGAHVIHYSKVYKIKKIISLAAGCGYPERAKMPFKEIDFWKGLPDKNSLGYSMAKKNLIIQSWTYKEQFGLNSVVLLPANLYGPNDNFDLKTSHVVPALIKKFINGVNKNEKKISIWGNGSASREFLFVDDLVNIIIDGCENVNICGPFNVGTGKETSISQLIKTIKKILNTKIRHVWQSSMPNGQVRRNYEMKNFKKNFNFRKFTSLEDGLKQTIKWYIENK
jgi:GDP-L-fucose synthase